VLLSSSRDAGAKHWGLGASQWWCSCLQPWPRLALLHSDGVPLVGVLQLGEPWQPEQRRVDGLPWLGCLPVEEASASTDPVQAREALRLNLLARWQLSSARGAGLGHPVA
jgi:hypothetical protein